MAGQLLRPGHGHARHPGLGGGVVGLPHVAGPGDAGNIDNDPLAAQLHHALGGLPPAEEHAGQVHVDDRLPLRHAHLFHDLAIPDLEQHAIAQNTGVVDQAVQCPEIPGDGVERVDHLGLVGNVGDIGPGFTAGLTAQLHRLIEFVPVEVDQRQPGPAGRQYLRHRSPQPLTATGNGDDFALHIHDGSTSYRMAWKSLRGCSGQPATAIWGNTGDRSIIAAFPKPANPAGGRPAPGVTLNCTGLPPT